MDSEKIINAFGGPVEVARLCEVTPQAIYQWFGPGPNGEPRTIPRARLLYLKALRPKLFKEMAKDAA